MAETRIFTDTRIFVGKRARNIAQSQGIYVCAPDTRFWRWYRNWFIDIVTSSSKYV